MKEVTTEKEEEITKPTTREVTAWLFIMATLTPFVITCLGYMGIKFLQDGRLLLIFLGVAMLLYFFVSFAGFFWVLYPAIMKFVRLKRGRKKRKEGNEK